MSFASTSESLAQLEYLAHVDWASTLSDDLTLIIGSLDDRYIRAAAAEDLPSDWSQTPPSSASAAFGDSWISSGRSAGLLVPSAIVEGENNVLLNPSHGDFSNLRVDSLYPFAFDRRLRCNEAARKRRLPSLSMPAALEFTAWTARPNRDHRWPARRYHDRFAVRIEGSISTAV